MPRRSYAFICGCGHSGTTLLANMFAAHPLVYVPLRETNTFRSRRRSWFRLLRLRLEHWFSRRPFLIEKTPRHVRTIPKIRKMMPQARFILVVRDGRDVAASFIKRRGSAQAGAERWTADNRIIASECHSADAILVRYEDLIVRPREELQRICAFLDIPFAEEMLDYHRTKRRWFESRRLDKADRHVKEHAELRNWQINQPIFDGRGKWKDALTEEDLEHFRAGEAGQLMAAFGYSAEKAA